MASSRRGSGMHGSGMTDGGQRLVPPDGVVLWSGGPPGAFMSGGCCVSHGTPGRSTGRWSGRIGRTPFGGDAVCARKV